MRIWLQNPIVIQHLIILRRGQIQLCFLTCFCQLYFQRYFLCQAPRARVRHTNGKTLKYLKTLNNCLISIYFRYHLKCHTINITFLHWDLCPNNIFFSPLRVIHHGVVMLSCGERLLFSWVKSGQRNLYNVFL